jgi:hypothetical protein
VYGAVLSESLCGEAHLLAQCELGVCPVWCHSWRNQMYWEEWQGIVLATTFS